MTCTSEQQIHQQQKSQEINPPPPIILGHYCIIRDTTGGLTHGITMAQKQQGQSGISTHNHCHHSQIVHHINQVIPSPLTRQHQSQSTHILPGSAETLIRKTQSPMMCTSEQLIHQQQKSQPTNPPPPTPPQMH